MARPIQVNDFAKISLIGHQPTLYIIRNINSTGIEISTDAAPQNTSLIISDNIGGWKIHGTDQKYEFEFIPSDQPVGTGKILTGSADVDILTLSFLDDDSLAAACRINKYAASLCENDKLWQMKVSNKYQGTEGYKFANETWKKYYRQLKKIMDQPLWHDIAITSEWGSRLAAKQGRLNLLKWLETTKGIIPNTKVADSAAGNGRLDIVMWLTEKNILPSESGLVRAAGNGHLNILKLFVGYDKSTANAAADGGHIDILEWLEQKGVILDVTVADIAAYAGHLPTVKWLAGKNIYPGESALDRAKRNNDTEMIKWLMGDEFPRYIPYK